MKLIIRKDRKAEFDEDTYYLATNMLAVQAVHMFIAYKKWDSICLELDDCIPQGALRFLHLISDDIRVYAITEQTETVVRQLSELYPELGGKIRRAYFAGKNVMEVIPVCQVY